MKIAVLIVAAGRGTRAGSELPKQYCKIGTEVVLAKTIKAFLNTDNVSSIAVAIHPDDQSLFEGAITGIEANITSVNGGETRTESVRNGLMSLKSEQPDLVLIHDAARPFVSQTIIDDVVSALTENQASVPALAIPDALKTLEGDAVDRENLVRVQTPQGFRYQDILNAYNDVEAETSFADDIEVARRSGLSIAMCRGDENNIKLTYPRDFQNAERRHSMINITGTGYDVHKVCEGQSLWLCGVEIDAGFSLEGHSDADVGLHAITDAMLGALSAGDIGDHFPPTDPQWKGAASSRFLAFAKDLVTKRRGIIDHVDVTLICEAPKIKPHRENMRGKISEILDIPSSCVSVKATTTEGLGFTGRKEGIASQALVSIRVPNDQ